MLHSCMEQLYSKNIRLILLDLDFTLLSSDKTISSRNLTALQKCQENGILIGFSTSRGNTNITHYTQLVKPDIVICNGGACTFYQGTLINSKEFSPEDVRKLTGKAYELIGSDCEMTLDTLDALYWNRTDQKSESYSPDSLYDDFRQFSQSALKICVQTNDSVKAELIAHSIENVDFLPFSDIPWYKFTRSDATKEEAMDFICRHFDITCDQIMSFGDDYSDIGMLKKSGVGVAMGNAIPSVKEIADCTTCTNDEDGVAVFLEQFFSC